MLFQADTFAMDSLAAGRVVAARVSKTMMMTMTMITPCHAGAGRTPI